MNQIFEQIESHGFSARANLASGGVQFSQVILSEPNVRMLAQIARTHSGVSAVIRRVLQVSRRNVDYRYENPFDVALCAYLLLVQAVRPDLSQLAAGVVLSAPNCWWSTSLARAMLSETPVDTDVVEKVITEYPSVRTSTPDQITLAAFLQDGPILGSVSIDAGSLDQRESQHSFLDQYQLEFTRKGTLVRSRPETASRIGELVT